jgi:riboflavin biosynthesis pyrimidine reductase
MEHDVQVLVAPAGVDRADLAALYAAPDPSWFRANMVSTLDGAAAGSDGRSGSINNEVDKQVFTLLRNLADVIVVGAGTARAEGYRPTNRPIVVVSNSGSVPQLLRGAPPGRVILATCTQAPGLADARGVLGDEAVWVLGDQAVDLPHLRRQLRDNGFGHVLCEGGPRLLRDLLADGIVDELCLTWVPELQAGDTTKLLTGPPIGLKLKLQVLLERNGTLLGRWFV